MKSLIIVLALSMLFALVACKATKPNPVEEKAMTEIKQKITIGGKNDQNPLPDTKSNVQEGKEHFGHHCQICHGMDGQNTGVPFAQQMAPPVADLSSKDVQDYTDGQLHWIIVNGINPSGMPAWKGILEDDEMWKMVGFIRHLPPKGSLGAPKIFEEEKEQHGQMQSKTGQSSKTLPHHHHH